MNFSNEIDDNFQKAAADERLLLRRNFESIGIFSFLFFFKWMKIHTKKGQKIILYFCKELINWTKQLNWLIETYFDFYAVWLYGNCIDGTSDIQKCGLTKTVLQLIPTGLL